MKNLNQMMKQAQQLQEKMAEMQERMNHVEMTGMAGGGMVKVTVNGKSDMKGLSIDPTLVDPKEIDVLEDLIIAAFQDAKTKVEAHVMKLPF
ncbi:MAG: uncharacterized protein K0R52_1325 [Alphaproteobacteria bacterium]|nr:uncharacterized protein [Alphaproteobacteria bacterium]